MVYAPVKVNITLGHGIKIEGDYELKYTGFGDCKIIDSNIHSTKSETLVGINTIKIDKSDTLTKGVPKIVRGSKNFYYPTCLEELIHDWSDEDKNLIKSY